MHVYHETLAYETPEGPAFVDITDDVATVLKRLAVNDGFVVVFSRHTTAAIRVNEAEPLLLDDMKRMLARVFPTDCQYAHNDFDRRTVNMCDDECANGHSHCQHLLMGTSESIPIRAGELNMGQWQRIFLVELDHARHREVTITVVGTAKPKEGP